MTITIRKAEKSDIPAIARIHVSGWRTSGEGIVDSDYLANLEVSDRVSEWQKNFQDGDVKMLLALKGNECVGFINYGPLQTAPPGTSKIRPAYSSEIYAIYLMPEFFEKGIGKQLLKNATRALQEQKHNSVCLWVLKDNKRACSFYDKMGGQRIGKKEVLLGPTKAKEVCYGWRDISEILKK